MSPLPLTAKLEQVDDQLAIRELGGRTHRVQTYCVEASATDHLRWYSQRIPLRSPRHRHALSSEHESGARRTDRTFTTLNSMDLVMVSVGCALTDAMIVVNGRMVVW
jgi:hypothetical protein